MTFPLPALFRPFSFRGRCTRSAYWWRVVPLNLAVLQASVFLFDAAFTADGAVSLSDTYRTAAIYLVLLISWLMAPYLLGAPSQPEAQDTPAPLTE